jgi:hypothetical protein
VLPTGFWSEPLIQHQAAFSMELVVAFYNYCPLMVKDPAGMRSSCHRTTHTWAGTPRWVTVLIQPLTCGAAGHLRPFSAGILECLTVVPDACCLPCLKCVQSPATQPFLHSVELLNSCCCAFALYNRCCAVGRLPPATVCSAAASKYDASGHKTVLKVLQSGWPGAAHWAPICAWTGL